MLGNWGKRRINCSNLPFVSLKKKKLCYFVQLPFLITKLKAEDTFDNNLMWGYERTREPCLSVSYTLINIWLS